MSLLPIAFLMGLLGSLHCAVMCGPIVLGLPLKQSGNWHTFGQIFLYQVGRVLAYTLLGIGIGIVGSSLKFYANQEALGILIGLVLILFSFFHLSGNYLTGVQKLQIKLVGPISRLMGQVFKLPFWAFFAGFLNGLIPCGIVYLALAAALNQASIKDAGFFMFLFGVGTTPLMFFVSIGGVYLKKYVKFNTQRIIPWFMLFMGVLFVLRGMDLDIPFFSPAKHFTYGNTNSCG